MGSLPRAGAALLLVCLAVPARAQWGGARELSMGEKMEQAVKHYEAGADDEAMDLFMEILVRGDPSEKALANDYLNRLTKRMSEGEQRLPPPQLPQAPGEPPQTRQPKPMPEDRKDAESLRAKTDRLELMRKEIEVRIAALRRNVLEELLAIRGVRVVHGASLPEAVGVLPSLVFDQDTKFKYPAADDVLDPLGSLVFTLSDAQVYVLPEGYSTNDSKVLDMRRAMALRAYLTGRGLSPARVRVGLLSNEVAIPVGLSDFRGMIVFFHFGKKLQPRLEGPSEAEAGPPASLGIWPKEVLVDSGQGSIIEFSALDSASGIASWKFQMLMPALDGGELPVLLQEVVGDAPVVHQIYWNGRRKFFGEVLPLGRYQVVLSAKSLRGRETVLRETVILSRAIAAAPEPKKEEPAAPSSSAPVVELPSAPPPDVAGTGTTSARNPVRRLRPAKLQIDAAGPSAAVVARAPVKAAPPPQAPEKGPEPVRELPKQPIGVGGIVNFSVYFERDSISIINEKVLQQVPANLSHYPLANLNLVGYAYKGEADPASLAEKRVQVVSDLLVQKYGVDKGKILSQAQLADDENTKVEIYISQGP